VRAAIFLCRSIWPLIKQRLPDAKLIIAGRHPHRRIAKAAADFPDVEVIADPPDMGVIYERANCTLIPLTEGGGTRIKILEAFASRTPVVATAKAAEGLPISDGTHFIVAESAEQFASAAAALFGEPGKADAMIARAESYAREFHSARAIHAAVAGSIRDLGL
jgi:glycosyltransferase involved in cell wall biosynthesis